MQAKDKFLEKFNFLIFILILCFSHKLLAENIYKKIFDYNNSLKNSSANFIQTDSNYLQEGEIFFGNKRIKINYKNPKKLTLILSEKKGMYINHELEESEFFMTKKSYIKFFFDIFYKKDHMLNLTINQVGQEIEIINKINLENIIYNIKLIYENYPIKLRQIEIMSDNEKILLGFFDHNIESVFDKNFFSMIDPYLN